ncbi:hypothetical protein [Streptomyces sp. NPDC050982]|uniref:hypothetical protein n=1 Tax=Streptomyces sp. NPDC050982 TaxID=3154746 RepID=UPI00340211BE
MPAWHRATAARLARARAARVVRDWPSAADDLYEHAQEVRAQEAGLRTAAQRLESWCSK